jgi:hypothetical protein
MFFEVNGVKFFINKLAPCNMKAILADHKKANIRSYPNWWSIVNDELVVWPKPEQDMVIHVLFD